MKKIVSLWLVIMVVLSGCGTSTDSTQKEKTQEEHKTEQEETGEGNLKFPQLTSEVEGNERLVEMVTSMGTIKIKLFPDQAPKAVESFITHAKDGYYEGVIFHRVINDFMIQGGDPDGTGRGGESIYGAPFEDEFSPELFNIRGALSMANAGPNTNGSQFFIVQNKHLNPGLPPKLEQAGYPKDIIKAYENGGTPHLDFVHTVFGQVVAGMDVVDKIAATPVGSGDKPLEPVVIKKIKILK